MDPDTPELPPDLLHQIDAACDRFEAEWLRGAGPRVEDFLGAVGPAARPALEAALRAVDAEYRQQTTAADPNATADPPVDPSAGAAAGPADRYEILEELGRGGMGVVHRARDARLNRVVALKRIIRSDATRSGVARFWAEAEVMAAVRHPHVVQVFELGEQDGLPFLAMEYLPGGSLARRVAAEPPLPPTAAAELVGKIAAGVAAAHELGIVHRDLKPGNVLLDAAGEPKVTDFGLAKRRAADMTSTQAFMGTPAYMAPEQAAGRAKFVGPQADVWALGVILYECLTGKRPFASESVEGLLRQIMSDDPVPLRTRTGRVPRDLDTIVARCLAKEPADRYPTAGDLAGDLGRFVRGEPIAARPVGAAERFARWVRRHPTRAAAWALGGTAAALLAVAVVVGGLWREAAGARDAAEQARGELDGANAKLAEALTGEQAGRAEAERARDAEAKAKRQLVFLNYGGAVGHAYSEYGANNLARARELLDACPVELRHWEWRHVHRLCHADLVTLAGHTKEVIWAAYSPDGRRVVTASDDATARVWDAETGRELTVLTGAGYWAGFSSDGRRILTTGSGENLRQWDADTGRELGSVEKGKGWGSAPDRSPDGTRVAAILDDHTVRVRVVTTGKDIAVLRGHVGRVAWAAFSPDGSRVVTTGGADRTVRLWDARSGAELSVFRGHGSSVRMAAFSPDGRRVLSASDDQTARVWAADRPHDSAVLKVQTPKGGENSEILSARFSPDGRRLLTGDGPTQLWDVSRSSHLAELDGEAFFTSDGNRVVAYLPDEAGRGGAIRLWDARTGSPVATKQRHWAHMGNRSGELSPDGRRWVTASEAGKWPLRVFETATGRELFTLTHNGTHAPTRFSFSADGRRVAAANHFEPVTTVWDLDTGRMVAAVKGQMVNHRYPYTSLSPDGRRLATWDDDIQVADARIWDVDTGAELARLKGHTGFISSVEFSPDHRRALTSAVDYTFRVWNVETGKQIMSMPMPPGSDWRATIPRPTFTPDWQRMVTYHESESARVWDVETGTLMLILPRTGGDILHARFTPDGTRIVAVEQADAEGVGRAVVRVSVYDSRPMNRAFIRYEPLDVLPREVRPPGDPAPGLRIP